jgi:hypothetical protein
MIAMSTRRQIANFFIVNCGLRRLHDTKFQKLTRAVLDEIDLQRLRDSQPCRQCSSRDEMYGYINASVLKSHPIDFLEFGVFQGESLRVWSGLSKDPRSRFYGFDSFEGLPETWRKSQGKGHFDVGGQVPVIQDARIKFVKGWFDQTVPEFVRSFVPMNRLVVHLDADLYSSTVLPLIHLNHWLCSGSLLIFDEFYDREHEFKAFRDFLKASRKDYRAVCEIGGYQKVCVELY